MSRPIHFEIHADDLERAKTFYADVFGWTFEDYGLMPRTGAAPPAGSGANAAVLTMGVADFDATAARIADAGGRVAVPKTALTGMAWQGYFVDTEGNTFGIHQPDVDAA